MSSVATRRSKLESLDAAIRTLEAWHTLGWSYTEIAREFHVTERTVANRVTRALRSAHPTATRIRDEMKLRLRNPGSTS